MRRKNITKRIMITILSAAMVVAPVSYSVATPMVVLAETEELTEPINESGGHDDVVVNSNQGVTIDNTEGHNVVSADSLTVNNSENSAPNSNACGISVSSVNPENQGTPERVESATVNIGGDVVLNSNNVAPTYGIVADSADSADGSGEGVLQTVSANVNVGGNVTVTERNENNQGTSGVAAISDDGNISSVSIGGNLTVESAGTDFRAPYPNNEVYGIDACTLDNGTATVTVGDISNNTGNVTVSGKEIVYGILTGPIIQRQGDNQGSISVTVGGNVSVVSSGEDEMASAYGVAVNNHGSTVTNIQIGGGVDARSNNGITTGVVNTSSGSQAEATVDVEKGIFASGRRATGIHTVVNNYSNTNTNVGKNSDGNAIVVRSQGNNPSDVSMTNGIYANLNAGSATINVEGNIIVNNEVSGVDGTRGIYAEGDADGGVQLKIRVKGNVISDGAAIYISDAGNAESVDVVIDGTVKSTANGIPTVVLDTDSINNENISVTAWKIESNEGTALLGKNTGGEILDNDNSQRSVASHISYIIRVTQPNINNAPANVLSLANADGAAWGNKKAWNNGEGDPTILDVAGENEKVYVKLDVPAGYQLAGVYADSARTVALTQDENGSYYLIVPRGGGIDVNVALELIPASRPQPSPNPKLNASYVIDPDILSLFANMLGTGTDNYTAEVASVETEQSVAPEQLSEIYAAQIQSMILSAPKKNTIVNGEAVTVIDLEFGNDPSFTADAVMALCGGSVAKRVHFTHDGKKYVLFVPVIDTASTAYSQCLALLNSEPGKQAGPIRLAQIFAPVGMDVPQE